MTRHGTRSIVIAQPRRHLRARRSVIHLSRMRRVALPFLPVGAVFADVVQQPRREGQGHKLWVSGRACFHGPPGQRLGHAGHAFAVPFDMGKHGVARP